MKITYKQMMKIISKASYFGSGQLNWIKENNSRFCKIIDIDFYKFHKAINKIIDMYFYEEECVDTILEKINKELNN